MSGTNEEIAELEARLAELKAAEAQTQAAPAEDEVVAAAPKSLTNAASQPEGFDSSTLSFRSKVANVKGPAPSELLSESWKEASEASEGGNSLLPVIGVMAALVGLVAFAQVPVGSEVQTFNDGVTTVRVETPAEIRARYAEAGYRGLD